MRKYTIVPMPQGTFEGVSLTARCVFGLIFDRWKLSMDDKDGRYWDDSVQNWYCYYAQDELVKLLGISARTVRRSLYELLERGIVYWHKADFRGHCRYYVGDLAQIELGVISVQEAPRKSNNPAKLASQSGQIDRCNPVKLTGYHSI